MISRHEVLHFAASLTLSAALLSLVGCGKVSAPTAESVPLNQLVDDLTLTQENNSDSAGEVAPTETGDARTPEEAESGAAPIGPRVSNNQPRRAVDPEMAIPPAPEHVYEPRVLLTGERQKTCLVGVGDAIPAIELPDSSGTVQKLRELLGEKLTVVVFWSTKNRLGQEQIERLPVEFARPFLGEGVRVVAINSGDDPDQIEAVVPLGSDASFAVLLDESGSAFASVATHHLPRTYLLDAQGRILWFDLEYSRNSVRELTNALHFFLGNRAESDS